MISVQEEKARAAEIVQVIRREEEQVEQLPSYDCSGRDAPPSLITTQGGIDGVAGPDKIQPTATEVDHDEQQEQQLARTVSSPPSSRNATSAHGFKTFAIYNDKTLRTYAFWNMKALINFRIYAGTTSDDPCAYYVRNCPFTPKVPDVMLHEGDSELGRVRATAKFYSFRVKGDITLAVGDGCERNLHASSSSTAGFAPAIYEELKKESVVAHTAYSFSTDLTRDGTRKRYVWRRKSTGRYLCWDYECAELAEGHGRGGEDTVARFENAGLSYSKSGDFRFVRSEGPKWECLVLIAFLSIREKENRFAVYNGIAL